MNKGWTLLAVGLLAVGASRGWAEEKPTETAPQQPSLAVAPAPCCEAAPCSARCPRLREWLCYRPGHTPCGACKVCPGGCQLPLYAYFLDSCGGPGVERLPGCATDDSCGGCGHSLGSLWHRLRCRLGH